MRSYIFCAAIILFVGQITVCGGGDGVAKRRAVRLSYRALALLTTGGYTREARALRAIAHNDVGTRCSDVGLQVLMREDRPHLVVNAREFKRLLECRAIQHGIDVDSEGAQEAYLLNIITGGHIAGRVSISPRSADRTTG